MKTDPSLFVHPRWIFALVCSAGLVLATGCTSNAHSAAKSSYSHPPPPVVDASEILRRDTVRDRTRELVEAGQKPSDARRQAEDENPATVSPSSNLPSPDYLKWKKQRAAQIKFEGQLDKMKRQP